MEIHYNDLLGVAILMFVLGCIITLLVKPHHGKATTKISNGEYIIKSFATVNDIFYIVLLENGPEKDKDGIFLWKHIGILPEKLKVDCEIAIKENQIIQIY